MHRSSRRSEQAVIRYSINRFEFRRNLVHIVLLKVF
jgi:hypothetical protein